MVKVETMDSRVVRILLEDVRACYLVRGERTVLIDSGLPADAPDLRQGLGRLGLNASDLDAVVLTHVHADHAGGAGYLVEDNPELKIYVHEKGAAHLHAPERLNEGVRKAYGSRFDRVGFLHAVSPESLIQPLRGADTIDLGSVVLRVLDAPGHAKHHVVLHDEASGALFSGDALGSRYEGLPNLVLSPPSDYDPEQAKRTIDEIRALHPKTIYFAHNGPYRLEGESFFDELKAKHDLWVRTVEGIRSAHRQASVEEVIELFLTALPELRHYPSQFFSFGLSVAGILNYLERKERNHVLPAA
ncbi:MAG: MBL fold metallo-hydrolase [Deltaproteobacteria bacterium]|nr:MBL fold metallo-hydrolase [Deltaproteobacteria bacterium]